MDDTRALIHRHVLPENGHRVLFQEGVVKEGVSTRTGTRWLGKPPSAKPRKNRVFLYPNRPSKVAQQRIGYNVNLRSPVMTKYRRRIPFIRMEAHRKIGWKSPRGGRPDDR